VDLHETPVTHHKVEKKNMLNKVYEQNNPGTMSKHKCPSPQHNQDPVATKKIIQRMHSIETERKRQNQEKQKQAL